MLPETGNSSQSPGRSPDRSAGRLEKYRGMGLRTLAENFLSLSVLQAAIYLMPLITLPYLVRVLGVEKFGLVAFAQALMQYFIIFSDYGFNLSATREIAVKRKDLAAVSTIFSTVLLIKLGLALIGLALLGGMILTFDRFGDEWLLYLLAYGMVFGNLLFPVWFFQGMEKMKHSTVLALIARAMFVVLIFAVVRSSEHYLYVPLLYSIGYIIAGIAGLVLAVRSFGVRLRFPSRKDIVRQSKESFQFFVATLSSSASASFNTLILGLLTSNVTVGYYAAAEKLFVAVRAAFHPLSQALYPYMAGRKNVFLFKRIFYVAMAGALLAAAALFVFSDAVAGFAFGEGYEPTGSLLELFALIVPIAAASILLSYPLLAALGREKYATYATTVGSLVHVLLVAVMVPIISAANVILVMLTAEIVVLSIRVYGIRKHHLWQVG
jgi:PST family polysaccharide transporter